MPSAAPAASPRPGGTASDPIDRDLLVQAWGDHVLRRLPARAKALFSAGRFVDVEGATASFALPNDAHRRRCEEVRAEVEAAITAQVGTPITLALVVDDGRAASRPGLGGRLPGTGPGAAPLEPGLDPDDDFDPTGPVVDESAQDVALARALEAFPGAQEVTG